MAKISALPPAAPLTGAETLPVVQGGATRRATLTQVVEAAAGPFVDASEASAIRSESARDVTLSVASDPDGLERPEFSGVAALLADTLITVNVVGRIWRTGGFVYREAGSAATDHHVTTAGGIKLYVEPLATGEVAPEQFGLLGAGANDNALLTAALTTGLPVIMNAAEYRFNQFVWTAAANIKISPTTIVRGMQTSGAKKPIIAFNGTGLVGSSTVVSQIGDGVAELNKTVTVASVAGLATGDTVMMRENEDERMETNVSAPTMQDWNYYEFFTIANIVGSVVTFEEYIGGKFDVANSMTLQKCEFLENAHISGGRFVGGNPVGGGVGVDWCRNSSALKIDARGLGPSLAANERMGGAAVVKKNCWECDVDVADARWTLYSLECFNIQSGSIDVTGGKNTTSGGVIIETARAARFSPTVMDNPGSVNGDSMGVAGRSWGNFVGGKATSGANCYTLWLRQPAHDNVFGPIVSTAGITAVVNCFGDDNHFQLIKTRGHGGAALSLEGNGNTAYLDHDGPSSGVVIRGGTNGNRVYGKSNCTGSGSLVWDVNMGGANITDTVIDMDCGPKGLTYGSGVVENHSNKITIRGPKPYRLGASENGRGFVWTRYFTGTTSTPAPFLIPGTSDDTNGLTPLVKSIADAAITYRITLKASSTLANTRSEYFLTTRLNSWHIEAILEGSSTSSPRLTNNAGTIEIANNGAAGSTPMLVMVEKS